jgi:hypothetical protein
MNLKKYRQLNLGVNVQMGANATLSWGQVTNQPTAAALGGLMANSTRLTYIDGNGIYSGIISADQIIAGKIKAENIDTTNLAAQKVYQQGYPANYAQIGGAYGDLQLHYNGGNYFTIYNGIDHVSLIHNGNARLTFSDASNATVADGTWDFSNATVKGITAVFG